MVQIHRVRPCQWPSSLAQMHSHGIELAMPFRAPLWDLYFVVGPWVAAQLGKDS